MEQTGIKIKQPRPYVEAAVERYKVTTALIKETIEEYDKILIKDSEQLRNYITNKLIEISQCGMKKEELKALELLGKISDVGLFTDKTEIKITNTDSSSLESSIKDKISKLLLAKKQQEEDEDYIEDAEYEEVDPEEFDGSSE